MNRQRHRLLDYLTPAELENLKLRSRIHRLLQKGLGVREASRKAGVSSATVINLKKALGLRIVSPVKRPSRPPSGQKIPWKIG
jgi:uncharacterized protein YerC